MKILISLFLLFFSVRVKAQTAKTDTAFPAHILQTLKQYASSRPNEKVYLQLDKHQYNPGDTVWFKAYNLPGESGVLYVELINDQDSVLQREKLRLNPCIAWGNMDIAPDYTQGNYFIRAYTQSMAATDNFFIQKINVGQPSLDAFPGKSINAQFYPEGGKLINGLRSKIAVRLSGNIDEPLKGSVVDDENVEQAAFTVGNSGIGVFALTPVAGKKYSAVLTKSNGEKRTFSLPEAELSGISLSVHQDSDTVTVKITANNEFLKTKTNKNFYVVAQANGTIYYAANGILTNGASVARIAKDKLPQGIVQFVALSQAEGSISTRLIYNQYTDSLKITGLYNTPQVEIKVTNNSGRPITGNFSMSVVKEPVTDSTNKKYVTDIISYMLIKSQAGNNAGPQIFSTAGNNDIDNWMLTEPGKKQDEEKLLKADTNVFNASAETGLALEGYVRTTGGKPLPGSKVTVFSLTEGMSVDTITNSQGHFRFDDLDVSGKATLIVKAQNKLTNRLQILIKETAYPLIAPEQIPTKENFFFKTQQNSSRPSTNSADTQKFNKAGTLLKEVKIKDKKITPLDNSNNYGASDPYTIKGSVLKDISPMLLDGLILKLPMTMLIKGVLVNMRHGSYPVVLNDHQIPRAYINNYVSSADVENVKLLHGFAFKITYGIMREDGYTDAEDIILITTKKFAGTEVPDKVELKRVVIKTTNVKGELEEQAFFTTDEFSGTIKYPFTGYTVPAVFNYTNQKLSSNDSNSQETTIYWNPNVATGADGKAFIPPTHPAKGNYRLTIEGIDGDGRLGRLVYRYKVE